MIRRHLRVFRESFKKIHVTKPLISFRVHQISFPTFQRNEFYKIKNRPVVDNPLKTNVIILLKEQKFDELEVILKNKQLTSQVNLNTVFVFSCLLGYSRFVEKLMNEYDVNIRCDHDQALRCAIMFNRIDIVKLLIEKIKLNDELIKEMLLICSDDVKSLLKEHNMKMNNEIIKNIPNEDKIYHAYHMINNKIVFD